VLLLLCTALVLTWLRPLDALAERQVEAGLKRALIAFASARALNAVLSALQEATVSLQVGAGLSIKPGAVLEPLDDVVEQFSNLMFVATASLAAQRLMVEVFAAWPLCAVLSVLLVAWAALRWRSPAARPGPGAGVPAWLPRLALALLLLRLAVPVLAVVSEGVHQLVLERPYRQLATQLSAAEAGETTGAIATPRPAAAESLLDRIKALVAQGGDVARQVEVLRARAQDIVENLVRLAAVFIVQTIVLPLIYVVFLLWLHRTATRAA